MTDCSIHARGAAVGFFCVKQLAAAVVLVAMMMARMMMSHTAHERLAFAMAVIAQNQTILLDSNNSN
jgi:hypothetical protein